MDIKIIVATHKKYWMPEDNMYLPVHVGHAGKEDLGYTGDDTGVNISEKNVNYCELTGLYWAWKNLKADCLGLVHYRRHFCLHRSFTDKKNCILTRSQAEKLLDGTDVVLPKPRNYYIETNYSQYVHAHHRMDLDVTRDILTERSPEYIEAFDRVMKKTSGHRFNMLIMRRKILDEYCTWLFDVLFELEKRLDISDYNANDCRVFGFVSERLLDVWLDSKQIKYRECAYIFMEKQNWLKKGSRFLMRKIKRCKP